MSTQPRWCGLIASSNAAGAEEAAWSRAPSMEVMARTVMRTPFRIDVRMRGRFEGNAEARPSSGDLSKCCKDLIQQRGDACERAIRVQEMRHRAQEIAEKVARCRLCSNH